ncbi:site-specific DNA-methyltransferase [Pseudactinotalea terrae]|uniref:site-specific DNA-methyltransferase n=1 Tax=Pseudactinotalea terrae TaxID=1743262 RepID=UPI0012E1760E|nr:site-specific DNA-methyltransferase [Pseudactinotalea terrae]
MAKTRLDQLLGRIESETLREQIASEIATLTDRTKFGLVYEEHLPEQIRLPGVKPRRRSKVVHRNDPVDAPLRTVRKITGQQVQLDDDTTAPIEDVVVVREYGEPLYPGLEVLERINRGGDKPDHVLIEAENLHALEALAYTHAESVDCIYIDPPYNTGGDLIYNDRYVGKEDTYRHSLWLSFMARRLRLARKLLKRTGVIIVAIDDNEHAHLKVLLDQEFGERNFLSNVAWLGSSRNDPRFTSGGLDYMLIYGRSKADLVASDSRWVETKMGYDIAIEGARAAWEKSGGDPAEATKLYRAAMRLRKAEMEKGVARYSEIDETGRLFFRADLSSPNPRPNLQYDLPHPVTGKPVHRAANGWVYSPETMQEKLAEGRILFGPDHTQGAYYKRYLDEVAEQAIRPFIDVDRRASSLALTKLLGEQRFKFPKDVSVVANWINAVSMRDPRAVVLDFFGGSGATMHAVMELNAADGGSRQCILVTNNEVNEKEAKQLVKAGHLPGDPEWEANGIFEHVTRPRISTVVTGTRPDGSSYSNGLEENVTIAKLTYLDRTDIERAKAFTQVANLLWLQAGAHGAAITAETDDFAAPDGAHYAICFNVDNWEPFVEAVNARQDITHAYVVTDAEESYRLVLARLRTDIRARRLYENYLTNFTTNTPR